MPRKLFLIFNEIGGAFLLAFFLFSYQEIKFIYFLSLFLLSWMFTRICISSFFFRADKRNTLSEIKLSFIQFGLQIRDLTKALESFCFSVSGSVHEFEAIEKSIKEFELAVEKMIEVGIAADSIKDLSESLLSDIREIKKNSSQVLNFSDQKLGVLIEKVTKQLSDRFQTIDKI